MPQVKIPPAYRGTTLGEARVNVEGSTVTDCIEAVEAVYPGFRDQVFDPEGGSEPVQQFHTGIG